MQFHGKTIVFCMLATKSLLLKKVLNISRYYQNYSLGVWLNGLENDNGSGNNTWKLVQFIVACASVVLSVVLKSLFVAHGSLKASQV